METTAGRQSAVGSLNQALGNLAEAAKTILDGAMALHRRLVGQLDRPEYPKSDGIRQESPLLKDTEEKVRACLNQIREAHDILQAIEREVGDSN